MTAVLTWKLYTVDSIQERTGGINDMWSQHYSTLNELMRVQLKHQKQKSSDQGMSKLQEVSPFSQNISSKVCAWFQPFCDVRHWQD